MVLNKIKKFECVCKEEFEDFSDFATHAMNCFMYQAKQSREAKKQNEKALQKSERNIE